MAKLYNVVKVSHKFSKELAYVSVCRRSRRFYNIKLPCNRGVVVDYRLGKLINESSATWNLAPFTLQHGKGEEIAEKPQALLESSSSNYLHRSILTATPITHHHHYLLLHITQLSIHLFSSCHWKD